MKYAICSGSHTASYKGCPVYQNIIETRNKLKAAKFIKYLTPITPPTDDYA
jgi:hypothetical protein